jgi:TetR/AcrR family transcriptional repressor of uid operon
MPESDSLDVGSMPVVSSRDRILLSAKHLFARNGYENTSTVAIAREAGTSESQLMKHFGSKQGLLAAIFDHGWAAVMERVKASHLANSSSDRLLDMLDAMILQLESDPELKELVALEARRVRKDNRDVLVSRGYQQFGELLHATLSEMRNQGYIRPDLNLDAIRSAIMGVTEALLRDQVVAKRSEMRADYNSSDIRKLLEALIPALGNETSHPLRAVNDR